MTVPHAGEWGDVIVRVESLRDRAQAVFQAAAEAATGAEPNWEIDTNREVGESAQGAIRPPLEALATATDEAYYGAEAPSAEAIEKIENEADALRPREPGTS